ncbi:MAG TPA: serine protease [Candidatus Acidoferrum sp.]|nr:serine protease [Candidatus Acidoferrum sp.]
MSVTLPQIAAQPKRAGKLSALLGVIPALACGLLAPTSTGGADASAGNELSAESKAHATQLVQDYRDGLVLVEGDDGRASGFIADVKGRKYLVTNAHVLADIKKPHFKLLDNSSLKLGPAMVAVGHDIIMVNVIEGGKGIPTVPFGEAVPHFGDGVVVPGNAGGERVVNPLYGTLVGIGTDRLEFSAPIEPGSSGSPIIHIGSGKVVGVATYLKIKPSLPGFGTNATSEPTVRHFGYRLDTVQRWEGIDWTRFRAEAGQMSRIENTGDELVMAFMDAGAASRTNQARHLYDSRAISGAVDTYYLAVQEPGQSTVAARDLMASLRTMSQSDILPPPRFSYDYFRRRLEQEQSKRKEIIAAVDKVLDNLQ